MLLFSLFPPQLSNKDSSLSFGFLLYHHQEDKRDQHLNGLLSGERRSRIRRGDSDERMECTCKDRLMGEGGIMGGKNSAASLVLDFWRAKAANLQSATYRGNMVVVKKIGGKNAGIDLKNRDCLKELNSVRKHEQQQQRLLNFQTAMLADEKYLLFMRLIL